MVTAQLLNLLGNENVCFSVKLLFVVILAKGMWEMRNVRNRTGKHSKQDINREGKADSEYTETEMKAIKKK